MQNIERYHPMLNGLKIFFSNLKTTTQSIETKLRIPLPFEVEIRFKFYFLQLEGSITKVIYVMLRAPINERAKVFNDDEIKFD